MKKKLVKILYALVGDNLADKMCILYLSLFRNKKVSELIKKNKQFYNIHRGERCFILGNGPSLKNVDFEKLSDEFVFSVNNFSFVEGYEKVKTNVHIWADLSFFELRKDQKYDHATLMDNYYKISKENPICFLPDSAFDFVKREGLDKILNINYYSIFAEMDSKKRNRFDLSKYISGYSTVVQYAISIAIYMGFKEIYLLGCDSTNIISVLNCALNIQNNSMHAYNNDDTETRYKELLKHWTMSEVFYDQYYLFEGYITLRRECEKQGIKLINCSTKTLINELPRMDIDEVLHEKNNSSCSDETK